MMELYLSNGGHVVVDSDDYYRYKHLTWYRSYYGYAHAYDRTTGNKVALHRVVMNAGKGTQIDHINQDKLDCRKSNLRLATKTQNNRNIGPRKSNTSGFKGVSKVNNRWRAMIWDNYRPIHLGYFATPNDAARAYNNAAIELHGDFACLNVIGE
jgi:hypothetical protein